VQREPGAEQSLTATSAGRATRARRDEPGEDPDGVREPHQEWHGDVPAMIGGAASTGHGSRPSEWTGTICFRDTSWSELA